MAILTIFTVSASTLPRGFIFQYGFLGGGQFKKSRKKWTFPAKRGGYSSKPPKTRLFTFSGALFKSGAALMRIR